VLVSMAARLGFDGCGNDSAARSSGQNLNWLQYIK
jgi:hypothetical protein